MVCEEDGRLLAGGFIALQSEGQEIDFRSVRLLNLEGCTDPDAHNYKRYYVASDPELTTSQLRSHLDGRLPDYMVPSVIVVLDELPLTPDEFAAGFDFNSIAAGLDQDPAFNKEDNFQAPRVIRLNVKLEF